MCIDYACLKSNIWELSSDQFNDLDDFRVQGRRKTMDFVSKNVF